MLVNVARTIGPAVAGVLIATVGEGVCFLVNAASFVAGRRFADACSTARRCTPSPPSGREPGQLREGLRYVRRTPELGVPLLMMALAGALAYEFQVTLPVMARQGLHVGAAGFGFMTAAMGVGAVVGGLFVAARGRTGLPTLVLAAAAFGVVLLLAALAPNLPLELDRARARRWREHLVHGDRQLDAAAERRAEHARPRDVVVVRRLPGLDADRRPDRRLGDRAGGRARGPRARRDDAACSSRCSDCSRCGG